MFLELWLFILQIYHTDQRKLCWFLKTINVKEWLFCMCVITKVACEHGHGHISCGSGWVHMKKANSHFESSCAPIWALVPKWGTTIGMCLCRPHIYISAKSNCNCPQVVLWLKAFSRLSHGVRLLGNLRPCSDPAAQPLCQGAVALGGEPGVLAAPARWQIALSPAGENVIWWNIRDCRGFCMHLGVHEHQEAWW